MPWTLRGKWEQPAFPGKIGHEQDGSGAWQELGVGAGGMVPTLSLGSVPPVPVL